MTHSRAGSIGSQAQGVPHMGVVNVLDWSLVLVASWSSNIGNVVLGPWVFLCFSVWSFNH